MRKVALAAVVLVCVSLPGAAQAAASTLLTDGAVYAMASTPSTLYLGGTFTRISTHPIGDAVAISTSTGAAASQAQVGGGFVNAVVSDGSGGWYLGGAFTTVGGVARAGVAHLNSDGTLDMGFAPTVNGTVSALLLSGSTLYLAGTFTTVDGVARTNVAAVSATSGALQSAFAPPTIDGPVDALAGGTGVVYVGGGFGHVGATVRGGLAALNTSDGSLDATFAPTTDVTAGDFEQVSALALSGSTLFAGGSFSTIDGTTNYLGAVSASTGAAAADVTIGTLNGPVNGLAVSGGTLYAVGSFSGVGAADRDELADFSTSTGALGALTLSTVTGMDVFATYGLDSVAVSGSTIYVGGQFVALDGTPVDNLAAVNAGTGAIESWTPNPGSSVLALAVDAGGDTIEAGGDIRFLGGTPMVNLAAMNTSDGSPVAGFSSPLSRTSSFLINSLALSGTTLYAANSAGSGSLVIAVNGQTGAVDTSFAGPTMNGYPVALIASGDTLYVGGQFNTIDGSSRQDLAALDLPGGSLDTSFAPPLTYNSSGLGVTALDLVGGTLYFGGNDLDFNGSSTRTVGAVSTADGSLDAAFAPTLSGTVQALTDAGGTLYVGGGFSAPAAADNQGLVGLSLTNGSLDTAFAPQIGPGVFSLLDSQGTLYAGGDFTQAGGQPRSDIAALNPSDGSLAPVTTAGAVGVTVSTFKSPGTSALAASGSKVYAGGAIAELGVNAIGGLGIVGPACSDVSASTAPGAPVTVQLACFDPGGNPLNYALVARPSHGGLGSISDSDAVIYTPAAGFTGTDNFTYDATASDGTTNTATVTITVGSSVGPARPVNTAAPMISGAAKAGKALSCSEGSWSNSPARFAYQWNRDGTPIAGATAGSYTVQIDDEGLTLTCTVTASNTAGSASPATSDRVAVTVPVVKGCPRATGALSGVKLGLLRLGMTRSQARKAYKKSSNRGKKYQDFFCLTPRGVRVGYASPALLKTLPRGERARYNGKVIWASTAYAFYSLDGVRPGATVAAAGKLLKLTGPFHVGLNFWYLAPNGPSTGVLKVRDGIVEEIGIGDKALTKGRRAQTTFLTSFS